MTGSVSEKAAGVVMGFWLASISAFPTVARFISSSSQLTTLSLLLGIAWPILYFWVTRAKFTLQSVPIDVLIVTSAFFLICMLSSFTSNKPLISVGFVLLTFI
jgi:hypothetical protein